MVACTHVALTLLCSNLLFTCTDSQYYYCPFPKSVLSMHCTNSKLLHAWLINHKHKVNYCKIQAFQLTKVIASWILSYLTSDIWIFCKTSIIIIRISYKSTVCLLVMLESVWGAFHHAPKDAAVNCSKDFYYIPVPCAEPKRDRTSAVVLSITNGEVSLAILAPLWHLWRLFLVGRKVDISQLQTNLLFIRTHQLTTTWARYAWGWFTAETFEEQCISVTWW